LPETCRQFWDQRREAVTNGVIHSGKFENYFYKFRQYVLPWVHSRRAVTEWMKEKSRDHRIEYYDRRWNNLRWRYLYRIFFSRFVMGRLGRDPEFFRYVEGSVGDRLLARTRYALTELSTHDNPYLAYILTGNYTDSALPRYLRPEHFQVIRDGLNRLQVVQGPIDNIAESAKDNASQRFDGFNLSDIFEYLSPELSAAVYGKLMESARPGARLVYWNMMVPRSCPSILADRIESRKELAETLFAKDKAWFYSRFVIDEVIR
jgi:S-adenosylmethionine-diacylglycerol 3-amino-3-carboxypropyl transferase